MRPVPHQNSIMCRPQDGETGSRAARAGEAPQAPCHLDAGFQRSQATAAKIGIFHYTTKSRQDFEVKVHRGSAMRETGKPWSFFDQIDKCVPLASGHRRLHPCSTLSTQLLAHCVDAKGSCPCV